MTLSHAIQPHEVGPGDHIYVLDFLSTRHAIVVEVNAQNSLNSTVVCMQTNPKSLHMTSLEDFAAGRTIRRAVYGADSSKWKLRGSYAATPVPAETTVDTALQLFSKKEMRVQFSTSLYTCEHFAKHCKTFRENSPQTQILDTGDQPVVPEMIETDRPIQHSMVVRKVNRHLWSNAINTEDVGLGDHIYVFRYGGLYTHHGIVVEVNAEDPPNSRVVHVQKEGQLLQETTLKDFAAGNTIRRAVYGTDSSKWKRKRYAAKPVAPETTVRMALELLQTAESENCYCLLTNNCEHFATHCKTCSGQSKQALIARDLMIGTLTLVSRSIGKLVFEAHLSVVIPACTALFFGKSTREVGRHLAMHLTRSVGAGVSFVAVEIVLFVYRFCKYKRDFHYSWANLQHDTSKSVAVASLTTAAFVSVMILAGPPGWAMFGLGALIGLVSCAIVEFVAQHRMFKLSDETQNFSLCSKHSGVKVSRHSDLKTLQGAQKMLQLKATRVGNRANLTKAQFLDELVRFLDTKIR